MVVGITGATGIIYRIGCLKFCGHWKSISTW
jgi:hypothetical protein